MKSVKLAALTAMVVSLVVAPSFAEIVKKDVPAGSVGVGQNGATVVAQKGSLVYARSGSNVQYWPGSKLVPVSQASSLPACDRSTVTASGNREELFVADGSSACTAGDTAVVAQEGSTVIYDEGVPLIRRPVRRR